MTTKQYLGQITRLNKMIANKLSEIYQLKSMACNISVLNDGEHIRSFSYNDKIGNMVSKIVDLETETQKYVNEFIEIRQKIIAQIDNVPDNRCYEVLFGRYIEDKSFDDISCDMGYSWRQVMRIHNDAIGLFEKMYGESYLSLNVIYHQ